MLNRILGLILVFSASTSWPGAAAKGQELPRGSVIGGVVKDDGSAALFVTGETKSFFVGVGKAKVYSVSLPAATARLEVLADGRFLLESREEPRDAKGHLAHVYRIMEWRGDRVRTLWEWNSQDFLEPSMHAPRIVFSRDGRAWGLGNGGATEFVFGRTRSRQERLRDVRVERADVGKRDVAVSESKWPMAPGFVFLDSDGPVVLTPWSGGAYILHFATNRSSPHAVPILFEDGVEEYDFRWQWEERVLWARTALYWKAYDLWNLGLSPLQEEPFLVVENSAEPHPERGVVRLATQEGSYRIEHVWRDSWFPVEERHVSDWHRGQPETFFVSPNGRHAVSVETRESEEGESRTYAQRIRLRLAPLMPPIELDLDAEIAADQSAMPWLRAKSERDQDAQQEAEKEEAKNSEAKAKESDVDLKDSEPGG